MAVAKSYENFEVIGEPFEKEGRKYVNMIGHCSRCGGSGHYSYNQMDGTMCYGCRGTGKQRITVRWYTDAERARMDRAAEKRQEAKIKAAEERAEYRRGAEYNGFANGFVIAMIGNTYEIKDELKSAGAKYSRALGWHFANEEDVPAEYAHMGRKITWEQASDEEGHIKSEVDLMELVKPEVEPSNSEYQGEVGQRLRGLSLCCCKINTTAFGYIYTFEDVDGNIFVWMTSTCPDIKVDEVRVMDATVKGHKEYNGVKQTLINRPRFK